MSGSVSTCAVLLVATQAVLFLLLADDALAQTFGYSRCWKSGKRAAASGMVYEPSINDPNEIVRVCSWTQEVPPPKPSEIAAQRRLEGSVRKEHLCCWDQEVKAYRMSWAAAPAGLHPTRTSKVERVCCWDQVSTRPKRMQQVSVPGGVEPEVASSSGSMDGRPAPAAGRSANDLAEDLSRYWYLLDSHGGERGSAFDDQTLVHFARRPIPPESDDLSDNN